MIQFANPEAEQALWSSRTSVAQFVMRLYNFIQAQVVDELRCTASRIHISFDGWTVTGGKRDFFGIVAHFATAEGDLRDVAIIESKCWLGNQTQQQLRAPQLWKEQVVGKQST
jgi:hypothetical protein